MPPGHGYAVFAGTTSASKFALAHKTPKTSPKDFDMRVSKTRLHHQQEARRMADDTADLEQQLDDKFQEILDAVAAQLKLGKYDDLSDADQERVENEAEVAADRWMDDNESTPKEPK